MQMTMSKRKSIVEESIGKTFGKLQVIKFVEFKKTPCGRNIPMVECECECKNRKIISLWHLRSGKSKTCGLGHTRYVDRSIPAFNNIYNNAYKNRAIKTGISFELDKSQFYQITQQCCHYCGCPPSGVAVRQTGKHISKFIYNGLDRTDSSKGYTLDNIVPCCGICNHAKHTMSYNDFIAWIDRLVNFRQCKINTLQGDKS